MIRSFRLRRSPLVALLALPVPLFHADGPAGEFMAARSEED